MNAVKRIKMIKAMEYVTRQLNDEDIFMSWLSVGIADGDIDYEDLSVKSTDESLLEYYLRDDNFADLMDLFLNIMHRALRSGGLYCDKVLSKEKEIHD